MSAREVRNHGMGRGIKRIAAIPTAIMANTVVVDIVNGAADLGVDLEEHITFCIEAMKAVAADLGLDGSAVKTA